MEVTLLIQSGMMFPGPTRRFRRVCEKLQVAIVNPNCVNPLMTEFVDCDNPSMSSDDTLAMHTASPLPEEEPAAETNGTITLLGGDSAEESDGSTHK